VVGRDPGEVLKEAIEAFRKTLQENTKEAWDFMMSYDNCSVRAFLSG